MQQPAQRRGHDWNLADDVRAYVEKVDRADRRTEGLGLLTLLVRRQPDEPLRVLDVGTGQGLLAARFLDAFPASTALGLDASEPMRDVATQRMEPYGDRFRFVIGDFVEGELPAAARVPTVYRSWRIRAATGSSRRRTEPPTRCGSHSSVQ
jgi:SAM-dependent methyltransferase